MPISVQIEDPFFKCTNYHKNLCILPGAIILSSGSFFHNFMLRPGNLYFRQPIFNSKEALCKSLEFFIIQ